MKKKTKNLKIKTANRGIYTMYICPICKYEYADLKCAESCRDSCYFELNKEEKCPF